MKILTINCMLFFLLISISKSIIDYQDTVEPAQEFRAAWSSPWGGDADLVTFISVEQFKDNMTYILDTLKMYNMNSLIYHVRTHDDALYQSKLNPISPYFKDVDYKKFDPLKWMIDDFGKICRISRKSSKSKRKHFIWYQFNNNESRIRKC